MKPKNLTPLLILAGLFSTPSVAAANPFSAISDLFGNLVETMATMLEAIVGADGVIYLLYFFLVFTALFVASNTAFKTLTDDSKSARKYAGIIAFIMSVAAYFFTPDNVIGLLLMSGSATANLILFVAIVGIPLYLLYPVLGMAVTSRRALAVVRAFCALFYIFVLSALSEQLDTTVSSPGSGAPGWFAGIFTYSIGSLTDLVVLLWLGILGWEVYQAFSAGESTFRSGNTNDVDDADNFFQNLQKNRLRNSIGDTVDKAVQQMGNVRKDLKGRLDDIDDILGNLQQQANRVADSSSSQVPNVLNAAPDKYKRDFLHDIQLLANNLLATPTIQDKLEDILEYVDQANEVEAHLEKMVEDIKAYGNTEIEAARELIENYDDNKRQEKAAEALQSLLRLKEADSLELTLTRLKQLLGRFAQKDNTARQHVDEIIKGILSEIETVRSKVNSDPALSTETFEAIKKSTSRMRAKFEEIRTELRQLADMQEDLEKADENLLRKLDQEYNLLNQWQKISAKIKDMSKASGTGSSGTSTSP